ncbi:MAG TPA: hypothetical protein VJY35_03365 [Candidatus Eisenbacteria bacterium]|nr:hypothetical protein [Candidatus Eisenbacteria bacterium]
MPPILPHRFLPALAGAIALAGCAPALRSPETFEWAGRPVAFSPPPADWRREGYNQGGWLGAYFVHERSVGERIMVAEHHVISDRDGRARLAELLERFDALDDRELKEALRRSRYRTEEPLSPLEAEVAAGVNQAIERAMGAEIAGDREGARREIGGAVRESQRLRIVLSDVLERVVFRPDRAQEPERWVGTARRPGVVAGQPAVFVDYRFRGPERVLRCRDAYFVRDNHVFIASYLGLEKNLPVFDRVVESIRFPEPGVPR